MERLEEDTRREEERQFNNQSKKANGFTDRQIPRETSGSIWKFLLMVLVREEEGISNHLKKENIPDGSMRSEIVEKARSSAECHERIQPGGNPPLHFPLCLTTGLLFTHRSEVRGHSEGQRAKAPPAAAGPADAAAQHCHLGEPDRSGRTHPAVPSGKCPAEASAHPHCDS